MKIDRAIIEDWLAAIFTAASVPNEEARLISHHLVDADASGHASHGIVRVPRYIDYLENEMVRPVCHSQTLLHQGPLMLMDGQYSFGQVLGHKLIDEATTLVRAHGVALIGLRHAGHLGRIGAWAELLADRGLSSVHFVTVTGSAIVAPFGSREARLSTAPVTIGIPHEGDDHFILDFATSLVAEGKILVSQKTGTSLPSQAMVDESGDDSDDPISLYGATAFQDVPDPTAGTGAIQTFGAHKGSGLGLACELLAGALTGSGTNSKKRPFCNGMLSIVFDSEQFDTDHIMQAEIHDFITSIRQAAPREKGGQVLIPGDKERQTRAKMAKEGVPLDEAIISDLIALSHKYNVMIPEIIEA